MSDSPSSVAVAGSAQQGGMTGALVELTKPSVLGLVMVTAFAGALVAEGALPFGRVLVALLGTSLVVGAANALNMYAERDADVHMSRTRRRPLPSGRLAPEVALGFGLLSASLGLNVLGLAAGGLACGLTLLAFVSYVFVYTPLKRVSPIALWVGALPGALPPLIGYAAARGTLGAPALWLFAILFFWQIPHFIAIALFREQEYRRAGMQVLPVARGADAAVRAMRVWTLVLAVLALLPLPLGAVRLGYALVAVPSSIAFVALVFCGPRGVTRDRWARRVFFASMPYLVVLFAAFVASSI